MDQSKPLEQREELTEKELHCLACHISQMLQFERGNFDSSHAHDICAYRNNCTEVVRFDGGRAVRLDPWDTFIKLSNITGVKLSQMLNRHNSLKHKMKWMERKITALEGQIPGQSVDINAIAQEVAKIIASSTKDAISNR